MFLEKTTTQTARISLFHQNKPHRFQYIEKHQSVSIKNLTETMRKGICFNLPYSNNVKINIGKAFFYYSENIFLEVMYYKRCQRKILLRLAAVAQEIWDQLFENTIDKKCVESKKSMVVAVGWKLITNCRTHVLH